MQPQCFMTDILLIFVDLTYRFIFLSSNWYLGEVNLETALDSGWYLYLAFSIANVDSS